MKILSYGAGVLSTALVLMSCENARAEADPPYPLVPVYDAVIYCDLGLEAPWVISQLEFAQNACKEAGIFFKVLDTKLYQHFLENFGERRTISILYPLVDTPGRWKEIQNAPKLYHRLQGSGNHKLCTVGTAGL